MFGQFRRAAVVAGAGVAAAAVLAGGVLAAPAAQEDGQSGAGKYADVFVTKLAGLLNIDKTTLVSSMKQAGSDTVDEAVAAGDLTERQGAQIKERIQSGEFPSFRGGGHHGKGGHHALMGIVDPHEVGDAVAQRLGLTSEQLLQEIQSGKTLHQIGQEKGVSDADLKSTILGVVQPKLEQAVADGKLTQEQADRVVERIQNADLNRHMFSVGPKHGHGSDDRGGDDSGRRGRGSDDPPGDDRGGNRG